MKKSSVKQSIGQHYKRILSLVCCLLCALFSVGTLSVFAHNTNTTHPRITSTAIERIEADDTNDSKYAEMYRAQSSSPPSAGGSVEYLFWGHDPRMNQNQATADAMAGYPNFIGDTVMGGIVGEDAPLGRVLSHFAHAYSGAPMPLPLGESLASFLGNTNIGFDQLAAEYNPSKLTAMRFLDLSIEAYGYNEDGERSGRAAKNIGYYLFGRALHHAEDMSSIAHVSGDPHLTENPLGPALETDDYEGAYVPTFLWNNDAVIGGYLDNVPPVAISSVNQIWPTPRGPEVGMEQIGGTIAASSLARTVFNTAVFIGTLSYPQNVTDPGSINPLTHLGTACVIYNSSLICDEANPELDNITATGELFDMFNDPIDGPGLTWLWLGLGDYASWNIRNVGDYNYQGVLIDSITDPLFLEDWWSVEKFNGPCVELGCGGIEEFFYIEQVMMGIAHGANFNPGSVVVPNGLRGNYNQLWDTDINPVVPGNTSSLLEIYAERLLPLAPAYAAGFSKYWFDIVNTPPYLKRVVVFQNSDKKYEAKWKDNTKTSTLSIAPIVDGEPIGNNSPPIAFTYVANRQIEYGLEVPVPKYMNDEAKIELALTFNEPIRTPDADNFSITLDDTTIAFDSYTVTEQQLDIDGNPLDKPWNKGSSWLIQIPKEKLSDLNGHVQLVVTAMDKNNHRGGVGAQLDADPRTPARRQRFNAQNSRQPFVGYTSAYEEFPWHTTQSTDINFEEMDAGDFAYTYDSGDKTHVLFFDNTPPEVDGVISIQK